ncbi:RDD family protein [Bacillus subtilis]|uniref:RDD family protein n=1 Tax=Bacillus subtilis TaxID=1423 RepID=UPI00136B3B2E|nr:RDD family protein [Bacillus subtilis]
MYKPAGFWIRLGAALLDYIIVSVPLLLIYWLITGKDPNDSLLTMFLRVIVAGLVYGITFGLGLIASLILIAVREDKRTLHDLIAGTYVTYATPGEEELNADEEIRKSV